jgi:hypothetical protein
MPVNSAAPPGAFQAYAITYAAYLLLGPGLPDRDAAKAAWGLNS